MLNVVREDDAPNERARSGRLFSESPSNHGVSRVRAIAIALLYATLVVSTPWGELAGREFRDFEAYLAGFLANSYETYSEGFEVLTLYSNEVVWRRLVAHMGGQLGVEGALTLLTAVIAATFAYALARMVPVGVGAWFLFNPLLLDLCLSQIRSGLAMALVLVAILSRGWLTPVLMLLSCFVHSAMIVVVGAYAIALFSRQIARRGYTTVPLLAALFSTVALVYLLSIEREAILNALGDRRAVYVADAPSLMYAAGFIPVWMSLTIFGRNRFHDEKVSLAAILVGLFIGLTVMSVNGTRFVAMALPLVIYAAFSLRRPVATANLLFLAAYQVIQLSYWLV